MQPYTVHSITGGGILCITKGRYKLSTMHCLEIIKLCNWTTMNATLWCLDLFWKGICLKCHIYCWCQEWCGNQRTGCRSWIFSSLFQHGFLNDIDSPNWENKPNFITCLPVGKCRVLQIFMCLLVKNNEIYSSSVDCLRDIFNTLGQPHRRKKHWTVTGM